MLTPKQIEFYTEFINEGLRLVNRGNDFTDFGPVHEINYPVSDLPQLEGMYSLRSRINKQDSGHQLDGGIGESVDLHLFKASIADYVRQFNESLPAPGKRGGDPGYDFIHRDKRIDTKLTRNTFNGFAFQPYYRDYQKDPSKAPLCDYFSFKRYKPSQRRIVSIGFARWEDVIPHLEVKPNKSGGWFMGLDLEKLYEAGLLNTNIHQLVNI